MFNKKKEAVFVNKQTYQTAFLKFSRSLCCGLECNKSTLHLSLPGVGVGGVEDDPGEQAAEEGSGFR